MKFTSKHKGIIYILGAAFFFALMNLFIQLSGDLPTIQKCFFRNIVAFFFTLATIIRGKEGFHIGEGNVKYLLGRSISGVLGVICNFYAIDHLNSISDASLLNKLSPFFAIIFSIFLIKEKPNRTEWLTVLIAFFGALFVIKPTAGLASFPAIAGLLGGMGAGLAYTFVRKLGIRGERGSMIVLFFSGSSSLFLLPFFLIGYEPMSPMQLIYLLLTGIAATGGQFCITAAYSYSPAKEISVFDYTQVLFAAILGFVFLGQLTDYLSFIGYIIIIGVAIYRWHYINHKS
ncbi:MAG: DMT family transporter [Lachnospiraceae bacterium]|nr:DMT family transporter [Lachnospiraceae bacterium]